MLVWQPLSGTSVVAVFFVRFILSLEVKVAWNENTNEKKREALLARPFCFHYTRGWVAVSEERVKTFFLYIPSRDLYLTLGITFPTRSVDKSLSKNIE